MSTEQKLEKEIEALDKEARDALDKLADKRDELEHQHQATGLAAERQREREEEKRRQAEEKARKEAEQKTKAELRKLGENRRELEVRAEAEAQALIATLGEIGELDIEHRGALGKAGREVRAEPFAWLVEPWLCGRLKPVASLGFDAYEGKLLYERDPLTPVAELTSPGSETHEGPEG